MVDTQACISLIVNKGALIVTDQAKVNITTDTPSLGRGPLVISLEPRQYIRKKKIWPITRPS
jgi:hypothetical protein